MSETYLEKTIRRFAETARAQEEKGIAKYGHELQPLDHKWDWLEMAKEELVDAFKYLSAERERRDVLITEINHHLITALNRSEDSTVNIPLRKAMARMGKLKGEGNEEES